MHEHDEATRNQKSYSKLILRQTKNLLDQQQEESLKEPAFGQAGNRSTSTGSKKVPKAWLVCLIGTRHFKAARQVDLSWICNLYKRLLFLFIWVYNICVQMVQKEYDGFGVA